MSKYTGIFEKISRVLLLSRCLTGEAYCPCEIEDFDEAVKRVLKLLGHYQGIISTWNFPTACYYTRMINEHIRDLASYIENYNYKDYK